MVVQLLRKYSLVTIVAVVTLSLAGCGSSEPAAPLERVVDSAQIFTVEDLRGAGMKASKQYNVEDLPGGVDAWYGFVQNESGAQDVEVRFYASHGDAVALGTDPAAEVSGYAAAIEEDLTTWPVGYKDRQRLRSGGTADLAAWSGQRGPNYADFVIFGNMVLLCQGDDPEQSIALCHELIAALVGDPDASGG